MYFVTCDEDHTAEEALAQGGETQVDIISQADHKLSLSSSLLYVMIFIKAREEFKIVKSFSPAWVRIATKPTPI